MSWREDFDLAGKLRRKRPEKRTTPVSCDSVRIHSSVRGHDRKHPSVLSPINRPGFGLRSTPEFTFIYVQHPHTVESRTDLLAYGDYSTETECGGDQKARFHRPVFLLSVPAHTSSAL